MYLRDLLLCSYGYLSKNVHACQLLIIVHSAANTNMANYYSRNKDFCEKFCFFVSRCSYRLKIDIKNENLYKSSILCRAGTLQNQLSRLEYLMFLLLVSITDSVVCVILFHFFTHYNIYLYSE